MAKLLSRREMELFHMATYWYTMYQDCNPNVGMGPSNLQMCKDLANKLSFQIDEDDIAEVCEIITGSYS